MSNYNNGNKKKTKEKNSFLNTNYKQKNHQSKFNSIGKLISMNYPFIPNDKNRKAFSKNKNNINFNETNLIQNNNNNNKAKSPNSNNIHQNLPNNSKSENDLYSNFSEKDLYGTIQNFSKGNSPRKIQNNINKVNVVFKDDKSENQVSSLHNGDVLYRNYFSNNKYMNSNYQPLNKI